ncbi:unnamed protein product, partial [Porites evermanni]
WCKCPKHERFDINKKWSSTDKSFGVRDSQEIGKHAKSKRYNCKTNTLFNFIPIDHVVIDTLHLLLRISDNLIELLIRELRRKDAIDKVSTFFKWHINFHSILSECHDTDKLQALWSSSMD